jgi:DNA-binding NarL/FixJ family response regulator
MSKLSSEVGSKSGRVETHETGGPVSSAAALNAPQLTMALIENRLFVRDCISRTLKDYSRFNVSSYPSVEKWIEVGATASLILWFISGLSEPQIQQDIALLTKHHKDVPIILVSDADDLDRVIYALNEGARGYLPTSVSLDVAIEAIHLVNAGGTYVPASSLVAAHRSAQDPGAPKKLGMFTARQAAVVEALRKGKANKIIAYELNMRESTVKVHVRSIMKKLKAKNRTEVAFLTNNLFSGSDKLNN